MKRLITFLIAVFLTVALSAQGENIMRYPLKLGRNDTAPTTSGEAWWRGKTSGTVKMKVADITANYTLTFPAAVPAATSVITVASTGVMSFTSVIDNATVFVKLHQDTLLITAATATMDATWAGKIVRFSNVTYTEVTIPANTMTAGDVVTLVRTSVAGPIRVNGGASFVRKSTLDSCTMNTLGGWYQIVLRTANKGEFLGDWRD
jgi:hypothetical protein